MPENVKAAAASSAPATGAGAADSSIGANAVTAALVYSVAGTLLTLANKLAIRWFPYASLLIAIQNLICIALLVVGSAFFPKHLGELPRLTRSAERRWAPLSALFVVMLTSSVLALKDISAVTLVVLRNLTTIVVAVGEGHFLQAKQSPPAALSLIGMLLAAVMYGANDLAFHPRGYAWVLVNIVASSTYQVYVKHLAKGETAGPLGMSYYNNVLSLPMLLACSLLMGEAGSIGSDIGQLGAIVTMRTATIIFTSGLLGYALSTSAFMLNKLISATSIMVLNNANKFAVILLSELLMERSLGVFSSIGTAGVLYFAFVYAECPRYGSNGGGGGGGGAGCIKGQRDQKAGVRSQSGRTETLPLAVGACGVMLLGCVLSRRAMSGGGGGSSTASRARALVHLPPGLVAHDWSANAYRVFLPTDPVLPPAQEFAPGVTYAAPSEPYWQDEYGYCKLSTASPSFRTCDQECNASGGVDVRPVSLGVPEHTSRGERTVDLVDRVLRYAWGPSPPSVDLYVRTGCRGAGEAQALFESIRLFWPRFLGKVVVVLDFADVDVAESFMPKQPLHAYDVRFEHVPCMPGRVFNQLSYMMADLQSSAEYIVTIDSDCIIHSPVTPDLLFREGKLRLAHSRAFQAGFWDGMVDYFFEPGAFRSHTMVMQPVPLHRTTFVAFRQWYERSKGQCYLDRVAEFLTSPMIKGWEDRMWAMPFCWMCQLGTFIDRTRETWEYYDYVDLDSRSVAPYQRMAIHTPYELHRPKTDAEKLARNRAVASQGLCRALGSSAFPHCANVNSTYLDTVTFHYSHWHYNQSAEAKARTLAGYQERIRTATAMFGY